MKKLSLGAIIVFFALLVSGCGSKISQSAIKEAEILYDLGKNNEALNAYNTMLGQDGENLQALIQRGKILVKFGRYEDALNDFFKASKIDNSQETQLLYKGLITMQTAVDTSALNILDTLTGTTTHQDMFDFYKCALLYKLNKNADAETCLDNLMAIDNNSPQANFLKAMTLNKKGKFKDSLKFFDKAEELDLTTTDLFVNKALSLAKSEMTGAIEYADKSLALDPNLSGAYYAKALGYFNDYNFKEALKVIDQAITIDTSNKDYYLLKGDVLSKSTNYDQAISAYDKVFELDPKNEIALLKKAIIFFKKGDTIKYNEIVEQIKSIITNNIRKLSSLSNVFIITKQYNDAMTYINKALEINSGNNNALFNKALTYYLQQKYVEANEWYSKIRSNYDPAEAELIYANYLATQSDYNNALNILEKILSKDPKNEIALASKVVIFDEMNKLGKTIPDTSFDYMTPSVLENAKKTVSRYKLLKNYR